MGLTPVPAATQHPRMPDSSAPEIKETPDTDAAATPAEATSAPARTQPSTTVLVLGFLALALLGALVASQVRGNPSRETSSAKSEPAEIAMRLKRDAETLSALALRNDAILNGKDRTLGEKDRELRAADARTGAVTSQLAKVQGQLETALADSASIATLKAQVADLAKQNAALADELRNARAQLAEFSQQPSPDDIADLKRRLDETTRAKSFFETRSKELETKLGATR